MAITVSETYEYAVRIGKDERTNIATPVMVEEEGQQVETVKYKHFITLIYELQDENRKRLKYVSKNHETEWFDERQSVDEYNTMLAPLIWEWDRQNRIALSGFDIGEYPG